MRSSHCARGKDSARAAYFLSPLATAPVAQSSEIRAATEPPLQGPRLLRRLAGQGARTVPPGLLTAADEVIE